MTETLCALIPTVQSVKPISHSSILSAKRRGFDTVHGQHPAVGMDEAGK